MLSPRREGADSDRPAKRPRVEAHPEDALSNANEPGTAPRAELREEDLEEDVDEDANAAAYEQPARASDLYLDTVRVFVACYSRAQI